MTWKALETSPAPENIPVLTKVDDGKGVRNIQTLKRVGEDWYFIHKKVKVNYKPTHWQYLGKDFTNRDPRATSRQYP